MPLVQAAARDARGDGDAGGVGVRVSGLSRKAIEGLHSPLARVVEVHEALGLDPGARPRACPCRNSAWNARRCRDPDGGTGTARAPLGISRRADSGCPSCCVPGSKRASLPASPRPRPSGWRGALGDRGRGHASSGPTTCSSDGKKICGILAESSAGNARGPAEERRLDYAILGMGMNANLDPADLGVIRTARSPPSAPSSAGTWIYWTCSALCSRTSTPSWADRGLRSRPRRVAKPELHAWERTCASGVSARPSKAGP